MEQLLVEFIAFAIIGALLWGVAIIYVKFFRRNDNSGGQEKSDSEKYNKYGEPTFWEPTPPKNKQRVNKCKSNLQSEKLPNELNDLIKAAEEGNADAQFHLGSIYSYGKGDDQDYTEAINWYAKYEQGDVATQSHLDLRGDYANSILFKKGAKKDYKKAVKWYTKAAEQGNAYAQSNLGVMYEQGQGVSQNYKEAIKWYTKAVEQRNAVAQNDLGMMCRDGKGDDQDYKEAVNWFAKAARAIASKF